MADAREDASPRRVVAIVCSGLTFDGLTDSRCPTLRRLAQGGAVALMSMPVTASPDETSAVLSLACGIPCKAEDEDAEAYLADQRVEGDPARMVLLRRTGEAPPPGTCAVVHLGIAGLQRRKLAEQLLGAQMPPDRHVGAKIAQEAGPDGRLSALLAVDEQGVAPCAENAPLGYVVHVGGHRRLLERCLRDAEEHSARIWVIGTPSKTCRNEFAARPTLTLMAGPDVPRGLLTSSTTRTLGLIAFSDVKPTLLHWFGIEPNAPAETIAIGKPVNSLDAVASLDRLASANVAAMIPVLGGCGAIVGLVVALSLGAIGPLRRYARSALYLLTACMALPVGFLCTGPVIAALPMTAAPWLYGLILAAITVVVGGLMQALSHFVPLRDVPLRRCLMVLAVTSLVIVGDGLCGQPLVKRSLLAACGMSGIRFYGVGNEYMGILVGTASGLLFLTGGGWRAAAALGAGLALFFGVGVFGANAGGVVTAVGLFAYASATIKGKRSGLWTLLWPAALGLGAAFFFAFIDAGFLGKSASHLGGTIRATRFEGLGLVVDIAVRKLLMNFGVLASWPALVAIIAFAAFAYAAVTRFGAGLAALQDTYPRWAQWGPAAAYGAAVAFLFNDTGTVAALFVFGVFAVAGLYLRLASGVGDALAEPHHEPSGRINDAMHNGVS